MAEIPRQWPQAIVPWTAVRNIIGTSDHRCGCRSWLHHWSRYTARLPHLCCACSNPAAVGGHIVKVGALNNRWYVAPLCWACSSRSDDYQIDPMVPLAPANVALTCGR